MPSSNHNSISVFGQTKLLFKKNFLSKIRQEPKKLIGEIFIPVLYLGILCYLITLPKIKTYPKVADQYEEEKNVLSSFTSQLNQSIVHIVPDDNETRNFTDQMNRILERLHLRELEFQFHATEEELMDAYNSNNTVDLAIVFPTSRKFNDYIIRIKSENNYLPPIATKKVGLETCRESISYRELESPATCPVNGYYYTNFLAIQNLLDRTFLEEDEDSTVEFKVDISNYPKEAYNGGIPIFLRIIIPLYSVIPMAQFINNLLVLIVTEKEEKIKDGLRMVGVSDAAYWISWFGVYALLILFFSIIFTLVMAIMVVKNMDPIMLFLLFFLFGLSVITFAFALTPLFHKPKTAGIVGTLVLQFTSLLFMLQTFVGDSASVALIPLRLISSLAFTTGLDVACAQEHVGGIAWSDLTFGGRGEGILISFLFLVFDIIFYALLATYLDNVLPNMFGVRQSPFYCFKPSYWVGRKETDVSRNRNDVTEETMDGWTEPGPDFEPISSNLKGKETIRIRHITKTYYPSWMQPKTKEVQAVKDISLNIYEGQITGILGKNGAGKSTFFNILIGLVSPTSGSANLFGLDISDPYDMTELRKMTGVCLQYDLHFNALTVSEHLEFYGKLRGLKDSELELSINTILTDLRLKEKRNTRAANLSGGQKRKLSIGIALIGDPKIILLDEPTAGVDPVSRRHLWDLLSRNKDGKVILLVTHFLDEADILADRKLIINDGEMKCMGSSLFLKNRFGVGYYLTIELNDRDTDTENCDNIIQNFIPSALNSKKIISNELKYSLPHTQVSNFSSLFAMLEENQESCGIKSYGVSMTTLEEVFLKISSNVEPTSQDQRSSSSSSIDQSNEQHTSNIPSDEQNLIGEFGEVKVKTREVLFAMCKLRVLRLIRSPQSLFFMVFMPVILAAVGLYLVKVTTSAVKDESIDFTNAKDIYPTSELHIALNDSKYDERFSQFLSTKGFTVHNFDGIFSGLLNINKPDGTMAGIVIENTVANILNVHLMTNGTFVHSTPIIVAVLREFLGGEIIKNPEVKVTSKPFVSQNAAHFDTSSFYVVFLLGPAFVFISVGMVMEIVYDREIKAKNHLRVNGLTFKIYFTSIFIVFGTLALIVTLLQLSLIWIFSVNAFTNPSAFLVTTILLLLYIPPSLIFGAIFSYLFQRMETAQSVYSQVSSWGGMIVALVIVILEASSVKSDIILLIHTIFSIFNIFYIPYGIFYYVNKQYFTCSLFGNCSSLGLSNYMGSEFTVMFFSLLGQIPVFLILLVIVDVLEDGGNVMDSLKSLFGRKRISTQVYTNSGIILDTSISAENEDEDVLNESNKVDNYFLEPGRNSSCVVAVQGIVKNYQTKVGEKKKKKIIKSVVNKLSLMVGEGEVFGLLGHNGAGKTTAIKIITAEVHPDEGNVKLFGYDIKSNISEAFIHLGYCPQHDVLWENITLKEHLQIYSAIRGIVPENRERLANHFLHGLRINEHAEKRTSDLSGGTKRKLSYALSMLGSPKVVLMDEPSTGMDPQSKRFLWNTVLGSFKESRGAILTTHSMDEADALCTRIAIMVKGSLLCIGTPQHLKTKFGEGYTLEVKIKLEEGEEGSKRRSKPSLTTFSIIQETFPGSIYKESFGNRAIFSIPTSCIQSISNVFNLLENLKEQDKLEEYSFSQTTLEQVFLGFAKENEDNEDE